MKYVRLRRRDPKHGIVLRQFVYRGIRFLEAGGWYVVDDEVADYLKDVRQKATDPRAPEAFDICRESEARAIDERENTESQPRRPADNARTTKARGLTSKDLQPTKKKGRPPKKQEKKLLQKTDRKSASNQETSHVDVDEDKEFENETPEAPNAGQGA